jgi:hypothetical protein
MEAEVKSYEELTADQKDARESLEDVRRYDG